jgi:hypothetical protein
VDSANANLSRSDFVNREESASDAGPDAAPMGLGSGAEYWSVEEVAAREVRRRWWWRVAGVLAVVATVAGGVAWRAHIQHERDQTNRRLACVMAPRDDARDRSGDCG